MANHHFDTQLETAVTYTFSMENTPLYEGVFSVIEGCWGTVQITKVLESPHAKYYHIGDSFEIKVAMYTIQKVG